MAQMIECKCENCKEPFVVRVADRKRGWGRFCSKSCKAIKQEKRTGQNKKHQHKQKVIEYAREFGGTPQFDQNDEYCGFIPDPEE